ncbi:DUF6183 family protein [Streptomyces xanthophaeus]
MNAEARELDKLVWEQTESRVRQGDLGSVRELGAQFAAELDAAAGRVRAYQGGLARIVRTLALTPGRESLAQLIRLLDECGPLGRSGTEPQFIASLLAEAQRPDELAELLYRRPVSDGLDVLRACLFHELLLRGVDVKALRPVARQDWFALSWLPTDLRPFETDAPFPSRSVNGSAGGAWTGLTGEGRVDPPTPRRHVPSSLRDIATVDVHEALVAAPSAGDFGDFGAWVFALEAPVEPALVPALVPSLPMRCVEGLGADARFAIARRSPADIWRILFSTASMGGVYGHGVHGAFGRRSAWWSLTGLSGAPLDASAQEVERQVLESTWFRFECDSAWFHNEIYDYGIVALSPDRCRLAVLAATCTD